VSTRLKRGYPTRELCLQRLEHYDMLIVDKGSSAYLQEQRDWWARMLANAQAHEERPQSLVSS
jgi:hypothetical protein